MRKLSALWKLSIGAVAIATCFTTTVGAQPRIEPAAPTVAPNETGTRLILLGTGGGPIVRANRSEISSLLLVDGRPYMIDVGTGTVHQLKKAGFEATEVTRLFLTHLHFDHTGGLASLVGFNWVSGRRQPIDIYGPPGTQTLSDGALQFLKEGEDLFAAIFPKAVTIREMTDAHDLTVSGKTLVYQDDKIRVYAVENSHYVTIPFAQREKHRWKSYSYRFETPDKVVVFSGDTGPSAALTELAKGADILVSEVIDIDATIAYLKSTYPVTDEQLKPLVAHMREEHLTPAEIGAIATKAGVKMVVLSHLAPGLDSQLSTASYTADIRKNFHGIVVAGQDLDQF